MAFSKYHARDAEGESVILTLLAFAGIYMLVFFG